MTTLNYSCGDKVFQILLPNHHRAHEWPNGAPGSDPVTVYPRAFAYLRTTPIENSILVNVSAFYWLDNDGNFQVFVGDKYNLTPHIPVTPNYVRIVALCLDISTKTLVAIEGNEVLNSALVNVPLPTITNTNYIPSAFIRIVYGALQLEEKHITDVRLILDTGRGSGSGSESLSDLSDVDDDLSPQSGDLLVYSGTQWSSGKILTDSNGDIVVDGNGNVLFS